ncbi:MAG: hypothetical protein Q9196_006302 [Gyalolechia fulgens]
MASPHNMNTTLAITTSEPSSSPATETSSSPETAAPTTMRSLPSTPAANPRTSPRSAPSTTTSTTTSTTAPSSVFSTVSLGFPRLVDLDTYSPDLSPSSNVDIPDLVITILYNYDILNGKNVLAAFLDFVNTEFYFVWKDLTRGQLQVDFHIEREGDMVLVCTLSPEKLVIKQLSWLHPDVIEVAVKHKI